MAPHHFLVGTFNTPAVFTIAFDPAKRTLDVVHKSDATGAHSWLSLNEDKSVLYATAWTEPPGLAAYSISRSGPAPTLSLINSVATAARSGYVCCSPLAVYSAGGPTGEVYAIDSKTGRFKEEVVQKLDFVEREKGQRDDGGVMDFGGLRHGAHSADLSPDGKLLYIADIGRNCIFVYAVSEKDGSLTLTDKNIAPRPTDGPRHVWPHPNGRYVYSLQEHTSMVDVFEVNADSTLTWKQGVKIIPEELSPTLFWADEVRLSLSPTSNGSPQYMIASTRGLEASQMGYVAIFALSADGLVANDKPLAMWETPTSGGWANAVQPAPVGEWGEDGKDGKEYIALTDSEEGLVLVLSWDGKVVEEVARVKLEGGAGAATAVWLD